MRHRRTFHSESAAVYFMMDLPEDAKPTLQRKAGVSRMVFIVRWTETR